MSASEQPNLTRWWWASALAGAIGGLVFAFYWMVTAAALGKGFWAPMNVIAAMFPALRPAAPQFDAGPSLTGAGLLLLGTVVGGLLMGWAAAALYPKQIRTWGGSTLISLALGLAGGVLTTLWFGPAVAPLLNVPHNIFFFVGCTLYMIATNWTLTGFAQTPQLKVTFAPEVMAKREILQR